MSFSMSMIKRKSSSKQQDIKSCYGAIYSNNTLTENVKLAIWQYCNYRFTKRNRGSLKATTINNMIAELLSKICFKPINEITSLDVMKNENEILYQIKRAIYYGSTRNLYYEAANEVNLDPLNTLKITPPQKINLNTNEVKDYFKDVMV